MDVLQVDVGVPALAVVDLDVRLNERRKLVVMFSGYATVVNVLADQSRSCRFRSRQDLVSFHPLFYQLKEVLMM